MEWRMHRLLDVDPTRRLICHFPQDDTIISVGSGYGGNVLLSEKNVSPCESVLILSPENKAGWDTETAVIRRKRLHCRTFQARAAAMENFMLPVASFSCVLLG